jgi:hypothetical protein
MHTVRAHSFDDCSVLVPIQRSILEGVRRLAVMYWTWLTTVVDIVNAYKVEVVVFCFCPEARDWVLR